MFCGCYVVSATLASRGLAVVFELFIMDWSSAGLVWTVDGAAVGFHELYRFQLVMLLTRKSL
jgi:hypothetical protein